MEISVVIPVYGCREALFELHKRLTHSLSEITKEYEIVLVNDKCPQNSWEEIEKLCGQDCHVIGIELAANVGQNRAIVAGLDNCCGNWVVVMDCDLQDQPEDIPRLYKKAQEGYDIVFARRTNRNDKKTKVDISYLFYKIYSMLSGEKYDPAIGNFSIASKKMVDCYCNMREYHRDYSVYMTALGFRQTAIEGHHAERKSGESSYTFWKKIKLAGEILTSKPDRLLSLIMSFGAIVSIVSIIIGVVRVVRHLMGYSGFGMPDVMTLICILCGLIIMQIGLIGIYIGKIFVQSKNRPLYFVRQIKNK